MIPEILEIMIRTACSKANHLASMVLKSLLSGSERLLSLNSMHIEYVLDSLNQNTSKIQNVRAYLLATLYNAPKTINTFYRTMVNHDMWQCQEQAVLMREEISQRSVL